MFGIESTDQLKQIAEGWTSYALNREEELFESRMKICKECPLFGHNALGDVCDSKKCYNPETGETSSTPGKGFTCGCGCKLAAALRVKAKKCVLNRWK